jgi:hypothetical protein
MNMSKPIYQLFVGNNTVSANLAWNALSEARQKELSDQEQASRDAVGAKIIVVCDSAWADEMHPWWGCIRFPDVQARIEHTRSLKKIGWMDITDAFSLLGNSDVEPVLPSFPNPIYELWIAKADTAGQANYERLSKGEKDALWAKWQASLDRTGSITVLYCNSFWANEEMPGFGISAYPSIEARLEHASDLEKLNWPIYFTVFSVLGMLENNT